jgi:hypothetical protein
LVSPPQTQKDRLCSQVCTRDETVRESNNALGLNLAPGGFCELFRSPPIEAEDGQRPQSVVRLHGSCCFPFNNYASLPDVHGLIRASRFVPADYTWNATGQFGAPERTAVAPSVPALMRLRLLVSVLCVQLRDAVLAGAAGG